MAFIEAGTAVKSGYYWNPADWAIVPVANDGDRLPGKTGARYRQIPLLLALLLVPLMGGLFLVFLPIAGFALTFQALSLKLARLFRRSAGELASTVSPGWQPGEAHFTGRRANPEDEAKGVPAPGSDEALEKLQQEIERRRRNMN